METSQVPQKSARLVMGRHRSKGLKPNRQYDDDAKVSYIKNNPLKILQIWKGLEFTVVCNMSFPYYSTR